MATKRKSSKKKAARSKGLGNASSTARCKEVTINGARRKLCWNRRGRIKSNVAVAARARTRKKAKGRR